MLNDKKLYYGIEAKVKLVRELNRITIEAQIEPHLLLTSSEQSQSVLIKNAMIAAYNRGIVKLRNELIKQLNTQPKEDDENDAG